MVKRILSFIFFFFFFITFFFGCSSVPKKTTAIKSESRLEIASLAKNVTKIQGFSVPEDETNTFSSEDSQAVMWVKLKDISGEHTLRWEWYDPTGELYHTTGNYGINRNGKSRDYSTSWHKIAIKGEKAGTIEGVWQVKVWLDDRELIADKEFEIIFDLYKYITRGPKTKVKPDNNKWGLIIGIERYKKTVSVPYAERDASLMKTYLTNFLGVPQKNIFTLLNDSATKAEIEVLIKDKLKRIMREGDTLYIYYSGHGIPADETPYLLPYDGDAESPKITAYPVEDLYKDLDQLPVKDVFIFMDTCFSGRSGRDEKEELIVAGVRPGLLKVRDPLLLSKKIIVMAAAKGNQLSNYYKERRQGLFTYYLLRGMTGDADTNGDKKIQIRELSKYVEGEVDSASRRLFGLSRQQNPVVMPIPLGNRENMDIAPVITED
jgi:hypothetical protein